MSDPNVNIAPSNADGDDTVLHTPDCPYLPFQETFPEPGESRPDCTCPDEYLARIWKLRWILLKRRLEELRGASASVMGQLWTLRMGMTTADSTELERLIRLWEDVSGETLLHEGETAPDPTPNDEISGNPAE
jgi:hypothetical protein